MHSSFAQEKKTNMNERTNDRRNENSSAVYGRYLLMGLFCFVLFRFYLFWLAIALAYFADVGVLTVARLPCLAFAEDIFSCVFDTVSPFIYASKCTKSKTVKPAGAARAGIATERIHRLARDYEHK